MEMGEPAGFVPMMMQTISPCWFCEEKPKTDLKNSEDESPASPEGNAEGAENSESNDASVLGGNLGNRPTWSIKHKVDPEDPIAAGESTNIVPAAHHLLPGGASVNKAGSLHKYMLWKGKNPKGFSGPIGYDINSAPNGVWLPGNYAVRKDTVFNKTWGDFKDPFKNAYARVAMTNAGNLQLHDAHPAYNDNARNTLIELGDKLDETWEDRSKCPVCKKKLKDQNLPPYGLIGRLNMLSGEHRKALIFPEQNRKAINSGYVTSSRVLDVFGK